MACSNRARTGWKFWESNYPWPALSREMPCFADLRSDPVLKLRQLRLRLFPPCVSYCYQWMLQTGRRCGLKCKYLHAKLPSGSASKSIATESLGQFSIDDGFKKVSNSILRSLDSHTFLLRTAAPPFFLQFHVGGVPFFSFIS